MSSQPPRARSGAPTDQEVQALLLRHRCPTPLHALRTLLLGNIASPRLDVSPMAALAQAWGGELPGFDSTGDVEELAQVIFQGLWNRLSAHQNARTPFRLPRFEVAPTRQALLDLARMRAQEIQGFVDGLFGTDDAMLLPQKAHDAVTALAELHALFDGAANLLANTATAAPARELTALLRNLQQVTIAADEQINKAVQSCKRARALGRGQEPMASVVTRRTGTTAADQEPELIESPLSQRITRHGVTVRVDIYRGASAGWILEVVDVENASHVWDDHFDTDQQALDAALRALDEEPLAFFGRSAEQPMN